MIRTVQDLINELEKVENKGLPIFVYDDDPIFIHSIDTSMSDRIDINLGNLL